MDTNGYSTVKETVEELMRVAMKGAALGISQNPEQLLQEAIRTLYPGEAIETVEHAVLCNTARERFDKQQRSAMANRDGFVHVGQLQFDGWDIPEHSYPPLIARTKTLDEFCDYVAELHAQSARNAQQLEQELAAAMRRSKKDEVRESAAHRVRELMHSMGYDTAAMTYEQAIQKAQEIAARRAADLVS